MNCDDVRNLLIGYLDGTLHSESIDAMEEHLEACQECGADLNQLKWVEQRFQDADFLQEEQEFLESFQDQGFSGQVMNLVRAEAEKPRVISLADYRPSSLGSWAMMLAAACVAALFFLPVFRSHESQVSHPFQASLTQAAAPGLSKKTVSAETTVMGKNEILQGAGEAQNVIARFLGRDLEDRVALDDFVAQFEDFDFDHQLRGDALVSR